MNYRHAFHAGNFADVHKHALLVAVLDHLTAKPAPFCYIDTHAGRGGYDLTSAAAGRSDEWRDGIGRLLVAAPGAAGTGLRRYLEVLQNLGVAGEAPARYPGSPILATSVMRAADRAVLVEQQVDESAALRDALAHRKHTAVICGDGYAELKAQLPPRERRGLILLDPPYESPSEVADLAQALIAAHARWPTGIYMVWYPIKPGGIAHRLHEALRAGSIRRILRCEFAVRPPEAPAGLNGSGILLVNPPWLLDVRARDLQADLRRRLAVPGNGSSRVDWLVPE